MRSIKNEIRKTLYFPLVCLSCLGVAGICLLSECYMDVNNKSYTVIELICTVEKSSMINYISLNQIEVWQKGFGTWAYLLLPFLLSASYLYVLSEERKTGAIRLLLIRESNGKYCCSKIVSSMLSGGIILVIGYLLFGLIVSCFFLPLQAYPSADVSMYMETFMPQGMVIFVVKRLINMFLYGMFINFFATCISLFFVDRYILLCLPMMLSYGWSQFVTKLMSDAIKKENFSTLDKLQVLQMQNILVSDWNRSWLSSVALMIILYFLLFLTFYMLLKKRGDSGGWT